MIKWSIKVFTWYSLSPPVGDFSQLVACPISRTCREEHKMYVPEMVLGLNSWTLMEPSWTLNAPDFRELECIFQLWTAHVGTQNWSIFLQIWGVDGFKTPRFLAICSPATIMMTMTTRPSNTSFSARPRPRFSPRFVQVTGGRNGYGAKLTNIFSTKFVPCLKLLKLLEYEVFLMQCDASGHWMCWWEERAQVCTDLGKQYGCWMLRHSCFGVWSAELVSVND